MAHPDDTLTIADWELVTLPAAAGLPRPVLALDMVRVGPSPRDPAYDAYLSTTQGSSVVWGDEWRFAKDPPSELRSLLWHVPERNASGTHLRLPPLHPAAIGLRHMGGDMDMPVLRDFTPERLVCLREGAAAADTAHEVAPGLCILAAGNAWCGWALLRPLDALEGGPAPPSLGPLIARWYALVSEATLDALSERDTALRAEITRLRDEMRGLSHPTATGVAAHADRVLESFYGP
jgi:hypothetical protein